MFCVCFVYVQRADFKRLWKMHECLAVIDLASDQSDSMKQLFQQAIKSSAFLRSPEVSLSGNCRLH